MSDDEGDFEEPVQAVSVSKAKKKRPPQRKAGSKRQKAEASDDSDFDIEAEFEVVSSSQVMPQRSPPPDVVVPMLPFQKESLAWMCKQEHGQYRGGILADEMGMGKTFQTIALIVTNRFDQIGDGSAEHTEAVAAKQQCCSGSDSADASVSSAASSLPGPSSQSPSSNSLLSLQTPSPPASLKKLRARFQRVMRTALASQAIDGDASPAAAVSPSVPLSTPIVDAAGDASPAAAAASSPSSPSKSSLASLLSGLAPANPCKTTLVICPVVAMSQWKAEIEKFLRPGCLTVCIYHGAKRCVTCSALSRFLTSFVQGS